MKINKLKKTDIIILIIIIIILLISTYFLIIKYIADIKINEELVENIINADEKKIDIIDLQQKYNNSDIQAILEIKNLDINIPIVQTTNNTYYINHTLRKTKNFTGALFIDYENDLKNGQQINIYGHNSTKYDLPFKKLEKYLDKNFFENNKEIILKYDDIIETYEIFSVAIVNKTIKEEHMQFKFNTEEQWENHFKVLQNKSIYSNGLILNGTDKIIVLQTCLFKKNNGKLLIISAKKINL